MADCGPLGPTCQSIQILREAGVYSRGDSMTAFRLAPFFLQLPQPFCLSCCDRFCHFRQRPSRSFALEGTSQRTDSGRDR